MLNYLAVFKTNGKENRRSLNMWFTKWDTSNLITQLKTNFAVEVINIRWALIEPTIGNVKLVIDGNQQPPAKTLAKMSTTIQQWLDIKDDCHHIDNTRALTFHLLTPQALTQFNRQLRQLPKTVSPDQQQSLANQIASHPERINA